MKESMSVLLLASNMKQALRITSTTYDVFIEYTTIDYLPSSQLTHLAYILF